MEVHTDLPGMQIYMPPAELKGIKKDNAKYGRYNAICFETQAFPNSMKFSHFPSTIVRKGEKYDTTTTYKFI